MESTILNTFHPFWYFRHSYLLILCLHMYSACSFHVSWAIDVSLILSCPFSQLPFVRLTKNFYLLLFTSIYFTLNITVRDLILAMRYSDPQNHWYVYNIWFVIVISQQPMKLCIYFLYYIDAMHVGYTHINIIAIPSVFNDIW